MVNDSFWIGHQMLGDVLGFCAAAHIYSVKIGRPVKVWFQPERKDACNWFDGVIWTEKTPNMIDCGINPSSSEWPNMNGVKRFYKFMDPTMNAPKSFDIHFSKPKPKNDKKLIGLITHSNTQGDIDPNTLKEMIDEARNIYPNHRIALIGNMDNTLIPPGVEDMRQKGGDVNWIINMVGELDLLITPQSGPCFCAAGWRIPMWIYKSKEAFWDYTLNYDEYKVEKWWDRKITHKISTVLTELHKLTKSDVAIDTFIELPKGTTNDDLIVQNFCELQGLLFFKDESHYYCINYNQTHNKYKYVGCGTSCKVFKIDDKVVKIFHDYKEDYYKELIKINQKFIKFPIRYAEKDIICNNRKIHIIEEQYINKDASVEQKKFLSSLESFVEILPSGKFPKIDLYINNILCNSGNIYLVDTYKRNSIEDNNFIADRESWKKYKQQQFITVDGKTYVETYTPHNIINYENGKLVLKNIINKDYNNYHSIDETAGKRNCDTRIREFDIYDIKNKTILDIGCSMGGMLIAASKCGAKYGKGLDYNNTSINFATTYCKEHNIDNLDFILQDIDDFDWFRTIEKFDTVFLLSILNTSNFSEKDSLISIANRLGKVLYIEGHSGEHHLSYIKKLYYHTDYTNFSHKYVTDGLGKRPLIRCGYGGFIGNKKDFK